MRHFRRSLTVGALCLFATLAAARPAAAQTATLQSWTTTLSLGNINQNSAGAIALAPNGDIYACNVQSGTSVLHWTSASAPVQIALPSNYGCNGVAVDASGNLYVAENGGTGLLVMPAGTTSFTAITPTNTQVTNFYPSTSPNSISVAGGEVYVADANGETFPGPVSGLVYKFPVGTSASPTAFIIEQGTSPSIGYATADATGNVFVLPINITPADQVQYYACASTCTGNAGTWSAAAIIAGPPGGHSNVWSYPSQIATDASGNLYVANDQQGGANGAYSELDEVTTPTGTPGYTVVATGSEFYAGVALDAGGNLVYDTNRGGGSGTDLVTEIGKGPITFRQQADGTSATITATFNITGGASIAAPLLLTQGATGGDFTDGGSEASACAGNAGTTCTVNVKFTPAAPGLRMGAVVLTDLSSNRLATVFAYGFGLGDGIAFIPTTVLATPTVKASLTSAQTGVTVDAGGNIYYGNNTSPGTVVKLPGSTTVGTGSEGFIDQIAVDGAGNIYFANVESKQIYRVDAGPSHTTTQPFTSTNYLHGVAVDGSGNVFVGDSNNGDLVEIPINGSPNITTSISGSSPYNVAADGTGNIFIADDDGSSSHNVVEFNIYSGTQSTAAHYSNGNTRSAAVDAAGALYVADNGGGIRKFAPGGGSSVVFTASSGAYYNSVAVDGSGNVFDANTLANQIEEYTFATPPTMAFGTQALGTSSSPQTVVITNPGNLALTINSINVPTGYSSAGSTCNVAGQSLAAGASCNLVITFNPDSTLAAGSDNGNIVVNYDSTSQNIPVTGTGTQVATSLAYEAAANPIYAGGNLGSAVKVDVDDAHGFPVQSPTVGNNDVVQIAITGPNSFSQSATATAVNGVATVDLSHIALPAAGTYQLAATDTTSPDTGFAAVDENVTVYAQTAALGSFALGSGTTSSVTVTVLITTAGTTGSSGVAVLTNGQNGLDFSNATGGTCAVSTPYTVGQTCTVKVNFTPTVEGLRKGAVVLYNASNVPMGTVFLSGTGTGGAIAFPGTVSTFVSSGVSNIAALATDGTNFYGASATGSLYKITSAGVASTLGSTLFNTGSSQPSAAMDGAGNLFILEPSSLLEFVNKNGTLDTASADGPLTSGAYGFASAPTDAIAVDGNGNIDVLDGANGGRLLQINSQGSVTVLQGSLGSVHALAVDPSGNFYVLGGGIGQTLYKIPAAGGSATTITGATTTTIESAAFDNAGNLYLTDGNGSNSVQEYSISGTTATAVGSAYSLPSAGGGSYDTQTIVDAGGNIFVANPAGSHISKVNVATPPAGTFAFSTTQPDGVTSAALSTTVTNLGNASFQFNLTSPVGVALTTGTQFALASGGGNCVPNGTVASNASCTLAATFTPTTAGAQNDTVTLVAANQVNSGASAPLSGTGLATTLAATAGAGQTARVSTAFANPLVVNVTTTSGPVQGLVVTFTGPGSGASIVTTQATTDSSGNATAIVTANATNGGPYVVTASAPDTSSTATVSLTNVNPASKFVVTPNKTAVVPGVAFTFGVTAEDNLNNTDPFYSGQVVYTSTDTGATLPATAGLTNGVATGLSATLVTGGNQTITATDSVTPGTTGTSSPIYVQTPAVTAPATTVGQTSATQTVTFTSPATAIGTGEIVAETLGQTSGSDFAVTGGTCAPGTQSGNTCTVNYTFTPSAPGVRKGAIVLYDGTANHNPLATIYVSGVGNGADAAYPAVASTLITDTTNLENSSGLTTDGVNFYTANSATGSVWQIGTRGFDGLTDITLASSATSDSLVMDGAGNLFALTNSNGSATSVHESIYIDESGFYTPAVQIGPGAFTPAPNSGHDLAVDGAGNIYVLEGNGSTAGTGTGDIKMIAAVSHVITTLHATPDGYVDSLALDAAGNLYFIDDGNVYKMAAGGGTAQQLSGATGNVGSLGGIALDAAGHLYTISTSLLPSNFYGVEEFSISGTTATKIATYDTGSVGPSSPTLDAAGNIYVIDGVAGKLDELNVRTPPTFNFPATAVSQHSAAILTTLQNIGNQPLTVTSATLANTTLYADSGNCQSVGTVTSGTCTVSVVFTPDNVNDSGTTETITDSDYATSSQVITINIATPTKTTTTVTLPAPSSPTYGTAVTTTLTVNTPASGTPPFPTPTGTIVYNVDGGTNSVAEALSGGQYTINAGILNAGSHTINVVSYSGDNVYNAIASSAATVTFNVAQVTLTPSLTGTYSRQYDAATDASPSTSSNFALTGLVNGDQLGTDVTLSYTSASFDTKDTTGSPTKTVSVTGLTLHLTGNATGNYVLSTTTPSGAIGTITQAPLTVTAQNALFLLGNAASTFPSVATHYTIGTFLGSDNAGNSTTGAPSITTTATATSAVGSYAITAAVGTLASTDYSFTYVNGALNIYQFAGAFPATTEGLNNSITVTFLAPVAETIGSVAVNDNSNPAANEFAITGGTCSTGSFAANATCTVTVKFTPNGAGVRSGAVTLFSNASPGLALQTIVLNGIGSGGLIGFPPVPSNLASVSGPHGIASDGTYLYVSNGSNGISVIKISDGSLHTTLSGLSGSGDVQVDGAGNVWAIDSNGVEEYIKKSDGTYAAVVNPLGPGPFQDMTVDHSGNVFLIANGGTRVFELTPTGGQIPIAAIATCNSQCNGLGVDAGGNLYYSINGVPQEVSAAALNGVQLPSATALTGISATGDYTFDAAGDLFTFTSGAVNEYADNNGTLSTTATALPAVTNAAYAGIYVDATGDVFASDSGNGNVVEFNGSNPAPFSFPNTDAGVKSGTIYSTTYTNIGNQDLTLGTPVLSIGGTNSGDFAVDGSSTCANGATVHSGNSCVGAASFTPTASGARSGALSFSAPGIYSAPSSITLSGNGLATTLSANTGSGQSAHINAAFATALQVKVLDSNSNPVQGLTITFSAPDASLSSTTAVTDSNGLASVTATANNTPVVGYTVTASAPDTSSTASFTLTNIGNTTHFVAVANASPVTASASSNETVTVTALDVNNQLDTTNVDTVHFTSTDPQAVLPSDTALVAGTGTFNVTLRTASTTATVTATDTNNLEGGSVTAGTTGNVTVNAGTAASLVLTGLPSTAQKGVAYTPVVTAEDAYGNTATGYASTITLHSSDGAATLAAPLGATSGVATFTGGVIFATSGTQTVSATDGTFTSNTVSLGVFPVSTAVGGTAITSIPVNFTFTGSATVASVQVVTGGATGQDFTLDATPGNCVGSFTAGQSCTAYIDFSAQAPGLRAGAVVLENSSSAVLQTAYVSGIGTGAAVAFSGATPTTIDSSDFNTPSAMTRDGAGNLYVYDNYSSKIYRIAAGQSTAAQLSYTPAYQVGSLTTDGAGNLWVGEQGAISGGALVEIPNESGTLNPAHATTVAQIPSYIAADGAGNIYFSDSSDDNIYAVAPGGAVSTVTTLSYPGAVLATDSLGNVYAARGNSTTLGVTKIAAGTHTQTTIGSNVDGPNALAVDAAGDLFIAQGENGVVEIAAGTGTVTTLQTSTDFLGGAALDAAGNYFYYDRSSHAVEELPLATAPTFAFGSVASNPVTVPSQTTTVSNVGNANLAISSVVVSDVTSPAQYSNSGTCSSSTNLNPGSGQTCTVVIAFAPTSGLALPGTRDSETVTLADNGFVASQTINLFGMGYESQPTITLTPIDGGSVTYGTDVTIGVAVTSSLSNVPASAAGTYTVNGGSSNPITLTGGAATIDLGVLPYSASAYSVVVTYTADSTFLTNNASQNISVSKAPLTVTPLPHSFPYGTSFNTQSAFATPVLNTDYTFSGFVNNDTASVVTGAPVLSTTATVTTSVATGGTITIGAGTLAAANYSFTVTPTAALTITKVPLTVAIANQSLSYGTNYTAQTSFTAPTLGTQFSVSGYVNSENSSTANVTGGLTLTTTAVATSTVAGSPYPITVATNTLSAPNYSFNAPVSGNLTVTPALLTVNVCASSYPYGTNFTNRSELNNPSPVTTCGGNGEFTLSGFMNGETITSAGVSGGIGLTPGASATSSVNGSPYTMGINGSSLSAANYTFGFGGSGGVFTNLTLTPLTLSASLINLSNKVYDTTANYTGLTAANYAISGTVNGDSVSLASPPTSGTYTNGATVVNNSPGVVSVSGLSLANSGVVAAGDYVLSPTTATGASSITPAPLTATIVGTPSKTYDGTTTATLSAANYSLATVLGSDDVALGGIGSPTTGTYNDPTVAGATTVTVTNLQLVGTTKDNYALTSTTATGVGTITKATITPALTGTVSKVYDAGTTATLVAGNYTFSGAASGDTNVGIFMPATGTYNDKTVNTGKAVTVTGIILTGSNDANYQLSSSTVVGNVGTITAAPLTASLTGTITKVYNQQLGVTLTSANYTLAGGGIKGSDSVSLATTPNLGVFTTVNAGTQAVSSNGPVTITGTDAGNYQLQNSGVASGTGTITQAPLTVTADDKAIIFGSALPTYTATLSGFQGSDSSSVVTGSPAFSTSPATPSAVGAYAITPAAGSLSAANYSFTNFVNGTLEIQPVPVSAATTAVGSTSAAVAVTFPFSAATTVASVGVLSNGSTDYASSDSSNCVGSFSSNSSCTIHVTFTPAAPGLRPGAVVLYGSGNFQEQIVYIGSVGTGARVGFPSNPVATSVGTGFTDASAVAVDNAGNRYVLNGSGETVTKVTAGGAQSNVATLPFAVSSIAFDGLGNLYGASSSVGAAIEVPNEAGTLNVADSTAIAFANPVNLAVDGFGNVYASNTAGGTIAEYNYTTQATTTTGSSVGANGPVALDASGNIYTTPSSGNGIVQISSGGTETAIDPTLSGIQALAVDAAGDVYAATSGGLYVVPNNASASPIQLSSTSFTSIAVDTQGDVFGTSGGTVTEISIATAPASLPNFGSQTIGQTTATTAPVTMLGIGNTSLTFLNLAVGTSNFSLGATNCSATNGLNSGNTCVLAPAFTPTTGAGALTDTLSVAVSALTGGSSSISLAGTGVLIPQTISFAPASSETYGVAPITLNATGGGSGNAVTFTVASGPASISGTTLTITGAGTVVINANQAGNTTYAAAAQVQATINVGQAVLTVTANAATRAYGAANPSFTDTITGYVGADSATTVAITGSPVLATTATATTGIGTAPITVNVSGMSTANYSFAGVSGALSITPASLTASLTGTANKTYDGITTVTLNAANFVLTGVVNGDNVTLVEPATGNFSDANTGTNKSISAFGLSITGSGAGNYTLSSTTATGATGTISPAPLTAQGSNATRVYGATNPTLTGTLTGNIASDGITATFASAATATTPVGSYSTGVNAVTPALNDPNNRLSNYAVTLTDGTLTITQASQTITFPAIGFAVPGSVVTLGATSTSGLTVSYKVDAGAATVNGNQLTVTGAGSITVEADQAGNNNYTAATPVTQTFSAGAPAVSASSSSLTFGSQVINTTSAAQTVVITNSGTAALHITALAATAPFAAASTCASATGATAIAAGGSCTISVTFTPTATGAATGSLTLTDDASGSPQTINLSGTGSAPGVSLVPSSVVFGGQVVGATSNAQSLTITNTGTSTLHVSNVAASGDFVATGACTVVAAGASCSLNVTFTPTATGTRNGIITITDDGGSGTQTVSASGTGTAAGISIAPTNLTFPSILVGNTSYPQTVTVTNTGTAALTSLSGSVQGDFTIANTTCGSSLAAGASCTVNVTYTPTLAGAESGTLTVTDSLGTQPVALGGTGLAPGANLSTSAVIFGGQLAGTTSGAQTVILTNNGTGALAITSVTAPASFSDTTSCASTLAAGASCSINVAFAPTASGAASGNVSVVDSAGTQNIAVSGFGQVPGLALTPSTANFGAEQVNTTSQAQTLTLTNTGTATLTLDPRQVSGDFVEADNCPSSFNPGASCQISLTFTPTALGSRSGQVTVTSGSTISAVAALSGVGTLPGISAAPATVFFGSAPVSVASAAQTVTVTNTGSAALTVSAVQASGDFAEVDTCTGTAVAPGAQCVVSVTMTPSTIGTRTGTLSIFDNADGVHTVALSGVGQAAGASLSPANLAFGSAPVPAAGSVASLTGTPQTITLTNTGNIALNVGSVAIAGDFAQSSTCAATLAAGASCSINVSFSPTGLGRRNGTLTVAGQTVTLSGFGSPTGLTFTPSNLNFGGTKVGATSAAQTATLTNQTGSAINNLSIVASGEFADTTTCTATLANGSSCTLSITITPLTQSAITGTISISGALISAGGSGSVIRGRLLYSRAGSDPQPAATQSNSGIGEFDLSGSGNPAAIGLSGSTLTFTAQAVGTSSAAQSLTITNSGGAALTSLAVASTPDFPITTTCTATLAAGANCTVSVTFDPTAAGARTGNLTVTASGGLQSTVALSGTATGGVLTVTPSSLDFGARPIGTTSASQSVTITNTGSGALSLQSLTMAGTDFAMTANTCGTLPATLAANASCTAAIVYTPSAAATSTGTLTVASNFGSAIIGLSGSGNSQGLALSATSLAYGNQGVGLASAAQTVTLSNAGASAVTLTSITAGGDFTQTNNCPASLAAAASCAVQVVFTPTATGDRSNSLTIVDSGATQIVALTGAGTNFTFAIGSGTPTVQQVGAGSSAGYQFTLTPGAFAGPVSFSCSGLPEATSCTFSPNPVTLAANASPTTVYLTVQTTQRGGIPPASPFSLPEVPLAVGTVAAASLLLFLLAMAVRRRRLAFGLMLIGAIASAACGGAPTNNEPIPGVGTPAGTYTITVTATAGAASQTTQIQLEVK